MYQNQTISIQFVISILDCSNQENLPVTEILYKAGISPVLINNLRSRITPKQLSNFIQTLSYHLEDELMGMAEQPMPLGTFELLARNSLHSDNLFEIYQDTNRALKAMNSPLGLSISRQHNTGIIAFNFNQDSPAPRILIEYILLIWHRFPSWLTRKVIPIESIQLPFSKPLYSDEYPLLFPGDVEFGCNASKLIIPDHALFMSCQRSLPDLKEYIGQLPEIWFKRMSFQDTISQIVVDCLEQLDVSIDSSMETVAGMMMQSVRTLRRNLDKENRSFQTIRAQFLRDKAVHLLTQKRIQIEQVSELLGYTEPAAFSRAFKQWTGSTPKDYKEFQS